MRYVISLLLFQGFIWSRLFPVSFGVDCTKDDFEVVEGVLTGIKTTRDCERILLDGFDLDSISPDAFQNFPNLKTLHIFDNFLVDFNVNLSGLTNLEELKAFDNFITHINPNVFEGLTNMKYVSFGFNRLQDFERALVQDLSALTKLNIDNNPLKSVDPDLFVGLEKLEDLGLDHIGLTFINFTDFEKLTALKNLKMNGNQISDLPQTIFMNKTALTELDLSSNKISLIPEGIFDDLFSIDPTEFSILGNSIYCCNDNLNALETLKHGITIKCQDERGRFYDSSEFHQTVNTEGNNKILKACECNVRDFTIENNFVKEAVTDKPCRKINLQAKQLKGMNPNFLQSFKKLERLYIQENKLSSLDINLTGLSNLREIQADSNRISNIDPALFEGLTNFRLMSFGNNQLTAFSPDVVKNQIFLETLHINNNPLVALGSTFFQNLTKIRELNLGSLGLSSLDTTVFTNNRNLRSLNLEGNRFSTLNFGVFRRLTKLSALFLNNNELTYLPSGLFKDTIIKPESFNITSNLLHCCDNYDIFERLRAFEFECTFETNGTLFRTPEDYKFLVNECENQICTKEDFNIVDGVLDSPKNASKDCRTINLDKSGIRTIGFNSFVQFDNLRRLDLADNTISKFSVNVTHLAKLNRLGLSGNSLSIFPTNAIAKMPELFYLSVSNNKLTEVTPSNLDGLANIRNLIISSNPKIGNLDPAVFDSVPDLERLSLDNIGLSHIDNGMFDKATNLKQLLLNRNNITSVSKGAFRGLNVLTRLEMEENSLTSIEQSAFNDAPKLRSDRFFIRRNQVYCCKANKNETGDNDFLYEWGEFQCGIDTAASFSSQGCACSSFPSFYPSSESFACLTCTPQANCSDLNDKVCMTNSTELSCLLCANETVVDDSGRCVEKSDIVVPPNGNDDSLSTGALMGIIFGVIGLTVVILFICAIVYYMRKSKEHKLLNGQTPEEFLYDGSPIQIQAEGEYYPPNSTPPVPAFPAHQKLMKKLKISGQGSPILSHGIIGAIDVNSQVTSIISQPPTRTPAAPIELQSASVDLQNISLEYIDYNAQEPERSKNEYWDNSNDETEDNDEKDNGNNGDEYWSKLDYWPSEAANAANGANGADDDENTL